MKGLLLLLLVIVLAIFARVPLSFSFVLAEFQRSECKTIMWSRDVAIFEPPVPCSRNFTRIRKEYRSSLVYVQLDSDADAGSDCSDCVSQKAWQQSALWISLLPLAPTITRVLNAVDVFVLQHDTCIFRPQ